VNNPQLAWDGFHPGDYVLVWNTVERAKVVQRLHAAGEEVAEADASAPARR